MRQFNAFRACQKAVSAIEFAIALPFMLLLYFGCVELSVMLANDRRVTSAAAAMGDLVARDAILTNADMTDIFAATSFIFGDSASRASMRVSSLYLDGSTVRVRWSDVSGTGMTAYTVDQALTVDPAMIKTGESVIMSEVEFDHRSEIGFVIKTDKILSDRFFLKPRRGAEAVRDKTT